MLTLAGLGNTLKKTAAIKASAMAGKNKMVDEVARLVKQEMYNRAEKLSGDMAGSISIEKVYKGPTYYKVKIGPSDDLR